jgi:hypothetical protein
MARSDEIPATSSGGVAELHTRDAGEGTIRADAENDIRANVEVAAEVAAELGEVDTNSNNNSNNTNSTGDYGGDANGDDHPSPDRMGYARMEDSDEEGEEAEKPDAATATVVNDATLTVVNDNHTVVNDDNRGKVDSNENNDSDEKEDSDDETWGPQLSQEEVERIVGQQLRKLDMDYEETLKASAEAEREGERKREAIAEAGRIAETSGGTCTEAGAETAGTCRAETATEVGKTGTKEENREDNNDDGHQPVGEGGGYQPVGAAVDTMDDDEWGAFAGGKYLLMRKYMMRDYLTLRIWIGEEISI